MQPAKLNILFLASWYPSPVVPFNGNFIQRHAEAVATMHKVTVLHAVADVKQKETFRTEISEEAGVTSVIVYFRKSKLPLISSFQRLYLGIFAYLYGYKTILKLAGKPDLIHLNVIFPAGLAAVWFKWRYGIPFIATEHWTGYLISNRKSQSLMIKLATKLVAGEAEIITTVSEDLKNALVEARLGKRIEVVNNVVDTSMFRPSQDFENRKFTFLHISTLNDSHKNISGILRVIKKLSEQRQDFCFILNGDGDVKPHQRYASELKIPQEILTIGGALQPAEVAEKFQQADCFLLFSNYENMPCVIIESLASGVPVISTNVGGISEHLTNDKGILIDAGNEDQLFTSMQAMLDSKMDFNKENLKQYAEQNFSIKAVAEDFDRLYRLIK